MPKQSKPKPRLFKGVRDVFAEDALLKQRMIGTVRSVYESYGYSPLETPAFEFVDVLGKYLPESATPAGGIFAFRNPDLENADRPSPDDWLALRYDLTAPLARLYAQHQQDLSRPMRRYQLGTVWRYEKPGPGRFREFTQFDFDVIGTAGTLADAEACRIICDVFEAIGFRSDDYLVRVNDRKILQGVLAACGLEDLDFAGVGTRAGTVLRAVDKFDRLGFDGVAALLGPGREDETGDFTDGARLDDGQIDRVLAYLRAADGAASRAEVCDRLDALVGETDIGRDGVAELRDVSRWLETFGCTEDRVVFDPTVVRGLGYYTGPVFEGVLTREIVDEDGVQRAFGSVYGGGRYDDLVKRFTGEAVPAVGASVGVDRLLEAMKLIHADRPRSAAAVLVTRLEKAHDARYAELAAELRAAGIPTDFYAGGGAVGKQLKYADKAGIPLAVIFGGDELERGVVQVKNLRQGAEASRTDDYVASREKWLAERPAQFEVPAGELVATLRAFHDAGGDPAPPASPG